MSDLNDLKSQLPIAQIAQQLGTDPATAENAIDMVLPTLVGGLGANAQDPAGAASLERALVDHQDDLHANPDLSRIDTEDGEKIARHIFGDNTDEVVNRLGGASQGGQSLIQKLIPILAPIVLSWIASQLFKDRSGGQAAPAPQQQDAGGGLGDILGGILGGGGAGGGAGGGLGDIFGGGAGGGAGRGGASDVQMPDIFNQGGAGGQRRAPSQPSQPSQPAQQDGGLGGLLGGGLGDLLGGGRR